jgi:queuine tRNA-ribosyltransferase
MLGPILLSIHNLTYYQRLLAAARQAIEMDRFAAFCEEKKRGWAEAERSDFRDQRSEMHCD